MFIMDASGSVGEDGWEIQTDFVSNLIKTDIGPESDIAVVQFSRGAWATYNFSDPQNRTLISQHVENLVFTRGATWTRTALLTAITVFDKTGDVDKKNIALLITDGNPIPSRSQSVCTNSVIKDELDAAGMYLLLCIILLLIIYYVDYIYIYNIYTYISNM